ncbi:2'-5' RNA ligase family protein [Acinetobacter sp. ANC 5414]|uniref:2'-5' RNA ligase family protein n=1 Tax=Acinetobacter sp. ANC 5414 TaxID=2731251 RepID=UPI0014903CEC|nr:2'-5' RNA ligase family protein [Acinetobacter sp. ANC 5414]
MFLKPSTPVVPTLAGDYPEWHRGREHFSLWYIEIEHPELLEYLNQLRSVFSDFLYTPNTRQFHITLFVCGFLTDQNPVWDDDFCIEKMHQHIQHLTNGFQNKIQLKTGRINSFESALFVEVIDENGILLKLRHLLGQSCDEIAPLDYCPHLTLGLYHQDFNSDLIFNRINSIEQKSFEFSVDQLTFGTYNAKILQGQLSPFHQFQLGDV